MIVANAAEYEQRAVFYAQTLSYQVVPVHPLAIQQSPPTMQSFPHSGIPLFPPISAPSASLVFTGPVHSPGLPLPFQSPSLPHPFHNPPHPDSNHYRPLAPHSEYRFPQEVPNSMPLPTGPLADLRHNLYLHRHRMPLFDTFRWTQNLEKGLEEAWRRWVSGTEFLLSKEWLALPENAPEKQSTAIWVTDNRPFMASGVST